MLELNPEAWRQLTHAYGSSEDIPELLLKLEAGDAWINQGYGQAEPWFSLWSALCHQGDVYTASYAAVPHLIHIAQPPLCLTSHIHEGVGIDTIGRTRIVNPGPLWQDHYAFVEIVGREVVALEIRAI